MSQIHCLYIIMSKNITLFIFYVGNVFLNVCQFFFSNVLLILVMTCFYSLSYLTTLNTQNLPWFYCRIMFHTKQTIMRKYIFTY